MVSAGTIRTDSNDINSIFTKYLNIVESCEGGNFWEGDSCNNFVNKANEFANQYKQNIGDQMSKLADAVDKYKMYEENEEKQKNAANNIKNAKDESEKANYQNQLNQATSEMDSIKQQINGILDEIVALVLNDSQRSQIESIMTGNYSFDERKNAPKLGDKWYSASDNGYIKRNKGITSPQCTWYAQGRFNEVSEITGNSPINIRGNANQMINAAKNAGFDTSYDIKDVKAGDMLVYNHNNYGHVVFVEKVNDDGSYVITSGNDSKSGGYFKVKERTYANASQLANFISGSSYSFKGVIHQTKVNS